MFTLTIPTEPIQESAENTVHTPGEITEGFLLADVLEKIAQDIREKVVIVPSDIPGSEWITEDYRWASRINGILIGATYSLESK